MINPITTLTLNKAEVYYILNALSMSKTDFTNLLAYKNSVKDDKTVETVETVELVLSNTEKLISKIEHASGMSNETV